MNVLIACEESQTVCKAFRQLGFNAYSCDIVECSGGHPEWHFKQDVFDVIEHKGGVTQNGDIQYVGHWDLMIAHPPCTFLSSSGAKWYYHPDDKDLPMEQRRPHPRFPHRKEDQMAAIAFFMGLYNADIPYIAIENPVGVMSTHLRKPDQIVQPFMFGDQARKTTCLWLQYLPPLQATNIVSEGESVVFSSGKKMPKWYHDALANAKTDAERRKLRSKTFDGIAQAMASQWGTYVQRQLENA